jgi:hypothetical protein
MLPGLVCRPGIDIASCKVERLRVPARSIRPAMTTPADITTDFSWSDGVAAHGGRMHEHTEPKALIRGAMLAFADRWRLFLPDETGHLKFVIRTMKSEYRS